jgi:hypothetical protein
MSRKLRNAVVAASVVVLGSSVLANRDWMIFLDYGGSWVRPQVQQETLFASVDATPGSPTRPMAIEQQLEEALEALGIVVD